MATSSTPLDQFIADFQLAPLPRSVVDRNGLRVGTRGPEVMLNLPTKVRNWEFPGVTPLVVYASRRWLIWRIEHFATLTVDRDFKLHEEFVHFVKWPRYLPTPRHVKELADELERQLIRFLDRIRARDKRTGTHRLEAYLERLRGWHKWCCKHDLPGFRPEFSKKLAAYTAPTRTNGKAVMSWNPEKGPLTRLEELQFRSVLLRDDGALTDRVAAWLTYGMGLRPGQCVLLLERDLHVYVAPNGERFYHLDVPRIKQPNAPVRSELKRRKIGAQLGALIESLILENREIVTPDGCERPLLLGKQSPNRSSGAKQWALIQPPKIVSSAIQRMVSKHQIVSVRTGTLLNASPRRLRYTFATNKAEFLEPSVLAELLDHSDVRSVLVYYNARETIGEELGRKLGRADGPTGYRTIMNAFAGIPIQVVHRNEAEKRGGAASRRFVPHELVTKTMSELPGLGNCGGQYKCGTAPIVSCYNCDDFLAWQEADHHPIVKWLAHEIEAMRKRPGTPESTVSEFELALIRAQQIVASQEASTSVSCSKAKSTGRR
jgi:hypothetical protein